MERRLSYINANISNYEIGIKVQFGNLTSLLSKMVRQSFLRRHMQTNSISHTKWHSTVAFVAYILQPVMWAVSWLIRQCFVSHQSTATDKLCRAASQCQPQTLISQCKGFKILQRLEDEPIDKNNKSYTAKTKAISASHLIQKKKK